MAEIIRFDINGFAEFLNGDRPVFNNFRIANSSWVIRCLPGQNKLQFCLSCCDNKTFFVKDVKLWLVKSLVERTIHTVTDLKLTKSQSIRKTIWLTDLVNWGFIEQDSLKLKVVIKLSAD